MAGISVTSTRNSTTTLVTTAGTLLVANPARIAWGVQNMGTNPLAVYFGSGAAIGTVETKVLKGGTGANDGLGGSLDYDGPIVYNGIITIDGTSPRAAVYEVAP